MFRPIKAIGRLMKSRNGPPWVHYGDSRKIGTLVLQIIDVHRARGRRAEASVTCELCVGTSVLIRVKEDLLETC